jgi:hypothetical protein
MDTPKKGFSKGAKITLSIIGGLIALLVITVIATDTPEAAAARKAKAASAESGPAPAEVEHRVIPGLNPVDVYRSLEKRGFVIKKIHKDGYSVRTCIQEMPSITFSADVAGPGTKEVDNVTATVMVDGAGKVIQAGVEYLSFIASVPYTGADPQAAHDWVQSNFDTDSATTTIGGASFTIIAPTAFYRMLMIDPAN